MPRGGARPGAGRPKKGEERLDLKAYKELPLNYMLRIMNDPEADVSRRDRMAQAAAPFVHGRVTEAVTTKKDQRQEAAAEAATKFAVPAPPRLIVDNA